MVGAILAAPAATSYAVEDTPPNLDSNELDKQPTEDGQEVTPLQPKAKKPTRTAKKLKREILASLDDPELGLKSEAADESEGDGFRLSKKGPIQYRQSFQMGEDELRFKIYGPVVKKKPGLRFRLEGLQVGDHPVRVDGFGNVKEGGLRFTIEF